MCVPLTSPTEVDGQVRSNTGFALWEQSLLPDVCKENPCPLSQVLAVGYCLGEGGGGRSWFPGIVGDEKRSTSAWQSPLH